MCSLKVFSFFFIDMHRLVWLPRTPLCTLSQSLGADNSWQNITQCCVPQDKEEET